VVRVRADSSSLLNQWILKCPQQSYVLHIVELRPIQVSSALPSSRVCTIPRLLLLLTSRPALTLPRSHDFESSTRLVMLPSRFCSLPPCQFQPRKIKQKDLVSPRSGHRRRLLCSEVFTAHLHTFQRPSFDQAVHHRKSNSSTASTKPTLLSFPLDASPRLAPAPRCALRSKHHHHFCLGTYSLAAPQPSPSDPTPAGPLRNASSTLS
jgi:hypothetical protein